MKGSFVRGAMVGMGIALAPASATAAIVLSVKEKVELSAPPEKVWDLIKDFGGLHTWHPVFASTEITSGKDNNRGAVRVLTTKDGAKITERLERYQPRAFSYTYRITDSPLPITDYVSTIQVKANKSGSVVYWSSHFKAKEGTADAEAVKLVRGVYRAGLDNLKEK